MRQLARFALAAGVVAAGASAASAQTTTGTTTTNGTSTGTGNGGASAGNSGFSSPQLQQSAQITGSNVSAGTLSSSNPFAQFYANPLYQGRAGAADGGDPGGFGTATYTSGGTGTAGRASGGFASSNSARSTTASGQAARTGTTGTRTASGTGGSTTGITGLPTGLAGTGGTAGRTGTTGLGQMGRTGTTGQGGFGNTGSSQSAGTIVAMPVQIMFVATARFPGPVFNAPAMQADLRGVLDRSSQIGNPRGISVEVGDSGLVVLRGAVRDQDEKETAEGMVRLTPGVKQVRNELVLK